MFVFFNWTLFRIVAFTNLSAYTAWAPDGSDGAPSLTFTFTEDYLLTAIQTQGSRLCIIFIPKVLIKSFTILRKITKFRRSVCFCSFSKKFLCFWKIPLFLIRDFLWKKYEIKYKSVRKFCKNYNLKKNYWKDAKNTKIYQLKRS